MSIQGHTIPWPIDERLLDNDVCPKPTCWEPLEWRPDEVIRHSAYCPKCDILWMPQTNQGLDRPF